MNSTEILASDATAVATAIAARKISSRQAVEAHLERLDAVNPGINAVVEVLREQALSAADVVDAAFERGERQGPLAGVPGGTGLGIRVRLRRRGRRCQWQHTETPHAARRAGGS